MSLFGLATFTILIMIKFIVILFIACAVGLVVSALLYPVTGAFAMIGTFYVLYKKA